MNLHEEHYGATFGAVRKLLSFREHLSSMRDLFPSSFMLKKVTPGDKYDMMVRADMRELVRPLTWLEAYIFFSVINISTAESEEWVPYDMSDITRSYSSSKYDLSTQEKLDSFNTHHRAAYAIFSDLIQERKYSFKQYLLLYMALRGDLTLNENRELDTSDSAQVFARLNIIAST